MFASSFFSIFPEPSKSNYLKISSNSSGSSYNSTPWACWYCLTNSIASVCSRNPLPLVSYFFQMASTNLTISISYYEPLLFETEVLNSLSDFICFLLGKVGVGESSRPKHFFSFDPNCVGEFKKKGSGVGFINWSSTIDVRLSTLGMAVLGRVWRPSW